jgi:type II secretory pathway pseudopilin PulG
MTLIELIVVLTVLAVVATLVVVYLIPAFQDNKNVIRGVDRVTTALLIAKQRALRDQAPRGVRFITTIVTIQGNPFAVAQQLQYIERPDPIFGTGFTYVPFPPLPNTPLPPTQLSFGAGTTTPVPDFIGGADPSGPPYSVDQFAVQPGDYFRFQGSNYLILGPFTPAPPLGSNQPSRTDLRLVNPLALVNPSSPPSTPPTWQIIRQTRPISGEPLVNLPQNVAVDVTLLTVPKASIINSMPQRVMVDPISQQTIATYFEVLFDPAGGVMNRGGSGTIIMVVSDITSDNYPDYNTARAIAINPRTGQIAAHPLAPPTVSVTGNPLQYALDGSSSGL